MGMVMVMVISNVLTVTLCTNCALLIQYKNAKSFRLEYVLLAFTIERCWKHQSFVVHPAEMGMEMEMGMASHRSQIMVEVNVMVLVMVMVLNVAEVEVIILFGMGMVLDNNSC